MQAYCRKEMHARQAHFPRPSKAALGILATGQEMKRSHLVPPTSFVVEVSFVEKHLGLSMV